MNRITRRLGAATLTLGLALAGATTARSDVILYATSITGSGTIYKVDIDTNTLTPVITNTGQADSLIFTPGNNIIYGNGNAGEVIEFNTVTHVSTVLASGFTNKLADLSLEPSGTSVLASDRGTGNLTRVFLSGGSTLVGTYVAGYRGLNGTAYDSSGHLYASNGDFVDQLNPVTGSILRSVPVTYADGMTYDGYSGKIFVASYSTNSLYSIDLTTFVATQVATGLNGPDGITADGNGNIFVASFNTSHIYQYNENNGTVTQRTYVHGLDDLAPASGLGAPTPEPSTLLVAGVGLLVAAAGAAWRRRLRPPARPPG
jgi:outer membrane protein assembly factor BamB